jgi:aspartyl-tRNA(Asn)/glutamyl-tRNA(Gln) amidotransferase subunit A
MSDVNQLTITQARAKMAGGELSSAELVRSCLDRIEARESVVKAWAHLDADAAMAQAELADQQTAAGNATGALHGIPLGIKDIFDVANMPTAAGTRAYPRRTAERDAASVARLREAGAIVLGKTVTTAFAMGDAGATTNPWNAAHTPGGSSSGSAAAVADRMCLAALGTQTAGSVIRPCSFTGLAGIKPTHAGIDIAGVIALSWRLDHVGMLTRSVADAALLWRVLREGTGDNDSHQAVKPVRLWRARELFEDNANSDMVAAMQAHCELLSDGGVEIVERPLPDTFAELPEYHQIIMASEAAASHRDNYQQHAKLYPPKIKALIEEGHTISATDYLQARQHRRHALADMQRSLADVDGMLCPAAAEAAPQGLDHTGERIMNVPSSYLGLPAVTYPVAMSADGLPLGVQIMGRAHDESHLLALADWCEDLAGFDLAPQ